MSLVGQQVRQFKILSRLGRGGMGDVYEALDQTLQRKVALKAIRAGRGLDPVARERFLREARILSQLDHPGICRIHDYITVGQDDFLVLELIDGTTLTEARAGLDRTARLRVAREIAAVLEAAHAEDIVHRDLKPDNVMITSEGRVKILDFGLARTEGVQGPEPVSPADGPGTAEATIAVEAVPVEETLAAEPADPGHTIPMETPVPGGSELPGGAETTQPGTVLGTPAFMSPEQALGRYVGTASDMYSFGLLLHWLFAGSHGYAQIRDVVRLLEDVKTGATLPLTGSGIDPHLGRLADGLKSPSPSSRPTAATAGERLAWILDKPRRRRRRWLVAAVLLAMVGAGVKYTADLRRERAVAESHRIQAEGLIGFMLGDLRDKLAPVGRLDVLDDVGDKALEYYAARRQSDLTEEEIFQLSKAVMQIGEVRLTQGDMTAAREAFREARAGTEDLLARRPDRTEWLAQLGALHFWIGNADYSEGRIPAAEEHFARYLDIAERLVALEPENPDWRLEVSYALTNLAAMKDESGDHDLALGYLDRSIAIKSELHRAQPDDLDMVRSLANSLAWAGRTRYNIGRYEDAVATFEQSAVHHDRVREADPRDTINLEGLASNHFLMAISLENLGRDREALDHFRRDRRIQGELCEHDPENAEWRSAWATSCLVFGKFRLRSGDLEDGRLLIRDAETAVAELEAIDPGNESWRQTAVDLEGNRAGLALLEDDRRKAREILDRAIPRGIELHEATGGQEIARTLANLLVLRGTLHDEEGRHDSAAADFERAADVLGPAAAGTRDGRALFTWARIQAGLGRGDEARTAVEKLTDMGFARNDFKEFATRFEVTTN